MSLRRCLPLPVDRVVAKLPASFRHVNMVQKRGESLPPVSCCCLAYPFERTLHAYPAPRPVRVCPNRFPLANPFPSIASAAPCRALFGNFSGTIRLSDFPCSFVISLDPRLPNAAVATLSWPRANRGSPGSRVRCFRACSRPSTAQDPEACRAGDASEVRLPFRPTTSASWSLCIWRLQYSACTSLSALRLRHCCRRRMTRGRCRWLRLSPVWLFDPRHLTGLPALSGRA